MKDAYDSFVLLSIWRNGATKMLPTIVNGNRPKPHPRHVIRPMRPLCELLGSLGEAALLTTPKGGMVLPWSRSHFLGTQALTDFSKMLGTLRISPRTRGTEQKIYYFSDIKRGDPKMLSDFDTERPNLKWKVPGLLEMDYHREPDGVLGCILALTSDGTAKRPYCFRVIWRLGKPLRVELTVADSVATFLWHDWGAHCLKGMTDGHRQDIRDDALGKVTRFRACILDQQNQLRTQMSDARSIPLSVEPYIRLAKGAPSPVAVLCDGWLLMEPDTLNYMGPKSTGWITGVKLGTTEQAVAQRVAQEFANYGGTLTARWS